MYQSTRFSLLATLFAGTTLCAPAFGDTPGARAGGAPINEAAPNPVDKADADMKAVLAAHMGLQPKPIDTLTPEEARQQPTPADAVKKVLADSGRGTAPEPGVKTRDITVKGAAGSLPARVYMPEGTTSGSALPVVVYYHGGGWVIADLDVYDATPRAISKMTGAIVISMHYRQAPEHRFPAAHEDAYAAYEWALANAASLGGDPARVAVMGESAGGNLALNVSIAAREKHAPLPVYQVLVYPVAGTDMNTQSYVENENARPLNKPMMKWFMDKVIRDEKDKKDPRLDLVGSADLRGLPPTTVITAGIDPLRTEGEVLAAKLQAAGVTVNAQKYNGVTHEFFGMGAAVAKAREAEELASKDLRNAFAKQQPK